MARSAVLLALMTTACAPAVPDLSAARADLVASEAAGTTQPRTSTSLTTTTSTTTTRPPTTTTTSTSTTLIPPGPAQSTVGAWSIAPDISDESGEQFSAVVTAPRILGEVDGALQARVASIVEGHIESQVGPTLALWRSIESQGERDLTGSSLTLDYEIAAFTEELLSLRFFSNEQVSGSGGAKREATTLMLDLVSGLAVGLDDIVLSGEARAQLLPLVQQGLLNDYFEGDEDVFNLWAGNLTPADLEDAALSPDGLEIWFDELEVGPPDIGLPVVLIEYSTLESILDPEGSAGPFLAA